MYDLNSDVERNLFATGAAIGYDCVAQFDFMKVVDECYSQLLKIEGIYQIMCKVYKSIVDNDRVLTHSTILEFGLNYPILTEAEEILHNEVISACIQNYDLMPAEVKREIQFLNKTISEDL